MYDWGDALEGGGTGVPSFLAVSIASAMVRGCVFCDGRLYLQRVYGKYGTTIWGQNSQLFCQMSGEKWGNDNLKGFAPINNSL